MSEEMLEKFIAQYLELFDGRVRFIWHGGEPLLAGLKFFRSIVEFQRRYRKPTHRIGNSVQTNGTLLTDEWAEFFKVNRFQIGVSLDGDRESHDRFRVDRGSAGTFDRVMHACEILRRHNVMFGLIQTVARDTAPNVGHDFDFFTKTLGLTHWGINVYADLDSANTAMREQTVHPREYTQFLSSLFSLWLARDDPHLAIREIESLVAGVSGKQASSCTFSGSCTGYFCLNYDGKVYPCDRLSTIEQFLFGDLATSNLATILNGEARILYAKQVNTPHPDCVGCEWWNACHNGCTGLRVGGTSGKYFYCETRRAMFQLARFVVGKYTR